MTSRRPMWFQYLSGEEGNSSGTRLPFTKQWDDERQSNSSEEWSAVKRSVIGYAVQAATNQNPQHAVRTIRFPTVQTYSALRRKLAQCNGKEWMVKFLQANGLALLVDALEKLCDQTTSITFVDTFLQSEGFGCIRAVMNSQTGLDYIVENRDFTRKLAAGELGVYRTVCSGTVYIVCTEVSHAAQST